jgi:hypothetical protein
MAKPQKSLGRLLAGLAGLLPALAGRADELSRVQTVFIIVMENNNWSGIKGSPSAPFINHTLLPMASYCEQYYNPPGIHPSEPNYLWLVAGTNFGIVDDADPASNHQGSTNHLATQLHHAGISWKAYQEDIAGNVVPLTSVGGYAVRHDPFVYFDDITGTNDPNNAYGIAHIRPYTELAGDLTGNTVARYNFITPNLCHDMHDDCGPLNDRVAQGDNWLAAEVPKIMASPAYQNNGAIFIVWDEAIAGDGPIGMILLSPLARGGGYFNNVPYTHSSTLRTMQEIFGVGPLLADAANATDLSDLFTKFSLTISLQPGAIRLDVGGVIPGRTNIVQMSTNLTSWQDIRTNMVATNNFSVTNATVGQGMVFYRVVQLP